MERYTLSILLVLVLGSFCFLVSCGSPGPYIDVLEGNFYYYRGDYERATAAYMQGTNSGNTHGRLSYNLGNVYFALGEVPAAIDKFQESSHSADTEILFRANYNLGVIYYQLADFEKSYHYFIEALKIKPSDMDSKIDLEYSLQKLRSSITLKNNKSDKQKKTSLKDSALRLLEYIQSREEYIWSSRKIEPSPDTVRDW